MKGVFLDNDNWYNEHPEKKPKDYQKEVDSYKKFEKAIEGMKHMGSICLDVWRWMAADASILAEHGEDWKADKDNGTDVVEVHVEPGAYVIEHYYDFPQNGDYLHSRIRKK